MRDTSDVAPQDRFLTFCEGLCQDAFGDLATCVMTERRVEVGGRLYAACHSGSCSTLAGLRGLAEMVLPIKHHGNHSVFGEVVCRRAVDRILQMVRP